MPKQISLTNSDKLTMVDDADFEILNKHKWYLDKRGYAIRHKHVGCDPLTKQKKNRLLQMHRQIVGEPAGQLIDHKNGDKLLNTHEVNIQPTPLTLLYFYYKKSV